MKKLNNNLKPPFNLKTIFFIFLFFIVFVISAQRVGIPDIVDRLYEASLDLIGVKNTSKINEGLSRISKEMWPPVVESKKDINLIHYTIGTPCFEEYQNKSLSSYWKKSFLNMLDGYYKRNKLK